MITSAKQSKKEYAEQPFSLNGLVGCQFTIEEKLGISEIPRVVKKQTKDGKKVYEVIALKISDGIFEKDMHIFENEWKQLCTALPDSIVNLQGVNLKVNRNSSTLQFKFEYIGVVRQDMDGNQYNNGNTSAPVQDAPGSTQTAPTDTGNQIKALHAAIELNQKMKIDTDISKLIIIADSIRHGDALGLIEAAKKEGWICEVAGKYRGT